MAEPLLLPYRLSLWGPWAATLSKMPNGDGEAHVVVASRELSGVYDLLSVVFVSGEHLSSEPSDEFVVQKEKAGWVDLVLATLPNKPISPYDIYKLMSKSVARQILSGHLIALRYYPILEAKKRNGHVDMSSRWEREFSFLMSNGETSLTRFTAHSYKALTDWGDTAPAQLLAEVESVSVSTIRNRLYAAREIGVLPKPGPGKRGVKR